MADAVSLQDNQEMSARAEYFYEKLKSEEDLRELVGQVEDLNLDAKEWHAASEKDCLSKIVEAACGFANASGGVVAIGLSARRYKKSGEDVISDLLPFSNPDAVASRVLDMIVQQIEPGIVGLLQRIIPSSSEEGKGFLMIYVKESDDLHRLRMGSRDFVQRIGSSTLRMEYYQIRDRFGRRPNAALSIEVVEWKVEQGVVGDQLNFHRAIPLTVRNNGRGLAHWPCIFVLPTPGVLLNRSFIGEDDTMWPSLTSLTRMLRS